MAEKKTRSGRADAPSTDSPGSPQADSLLRQRSDGQAGQGLRRRAEEIARAKAAQMPESMAALSPEAARQVLHELRVHQIELEMQNDELCRTQAAWEASRARYFDLYDLAPVGYFTLGEKGLILEANLTAATLLGVTRAALVKQPLTRFILPEDQDIYYRHRQQLFAAGAPQVCELRLMKNDGTQCWARVEATVGQDAEGGPPVCRAVVSDVTNRKRAEEALKKERDKAQQYLDVAGVLIVVIEANQRVSLINQKGCDVLGYQEEDIIGANWFDMFLPESDREGIKAFFGRVIAGEVEAADYFENVIITKKGEKKVIGWRNTVLRDRRDNIIGTLSSGLDITESKAMAEELSRKNALLAGLLDSIPDRVFFKNRGGIYLGCNPEFSRFVGRPREEIVGRTDYDLFPKEKADFYRETDRAMMERGEPRRMESWIDYPDGSRLLSDAIKAPLRSVTGELIGLVGVSRDITEFKRAEEQIMASLREKEVLLKEIHHRVKNNLQVISSLLHLQSQSIQDPQNLEIFRESQNRVRSLALVHERLLRSPDLASVDFGEYIRNIVSSLFSSYHTLAQGVSSEVEAEEIYLGVDLATPCGLILNELISNALKHAFPEGRRGKISISFHRREKGQYVMRVRDDGIGFPPALDIGHTETLGLQLVDTLSKQLAGTLELNREGGADFTLTFGGEDSAGGKHG
jgi:PAS domain S-box-containing protein